MTARCARIPPPPQRVRAVQLEVQAQKDRNALEDAKRQNKDDREILMDEIAEMKVKVQNVDEKGNAKMKTQLSQLTTKVVALAPHDRPQEEEGGFRSRRAPRRRAVAIARAAGWAGGSRERERATR